MGLDPGIFASATILILLLVLFDRPMFFWNRSNCARGYKVLSLLCFSVFLTAIVTAVMLTVVI